MAGGFAWDPPPPRVPLWSPPKAGRIFLSLNPFGVEGAEAKFYCLRQGTSKRVLEHLS